MATYVVGQLLIATGWVAVQSRDVARVDVVATSDV
jgi:hypothetical protein